MTDAPSFAPNSNVVVLSDGRIAAFDTSRPDTISIRDTSGTEVDTIVINEEGLLTDGLAVISPPTPELRQADMAATADGGLVVGHQWDGILRRFDASGDQVWEVSVGGDAYDALAIMGIDVAPDGTIWAAMYAGHARQFSDADGTLLNTISGFSVPSDIVAMSDGSIAVADSGTNSVDHRDSSGALIGTIIAEEWSAIEQGPDGRLWGIPFASNEVHYVNVNGSGPGEFGVTGTADGELQGPADIALNAAGDVLVVEGVGQGRIQRFDDSGTYQDKIGSGAGSSAIPYGISAGPDGMTAVGASSLPLIRILDETGDEVDAFGTIGIGPGSFAGGAVPTYDTDSTLWVVDGTQSLIHHLDEDGTLLGSIDTSGEGIIGSQVDVAADGSILVTSWSNDLVGRYSSAGALQALWGGSGATDGLFGSISGIKGAPDGSVYVSDASDGRLQKFSDTGTHEATHTLNQLWVASGPSGFAVLPDGNLALGHSASLRITNGTTAVESGTIGARTNIDGASIGQARLVDVGPDGDIVLVESLSAFRISRWSPDSTAPSASPTTSAGASSVTFEANATDGGQLANEAYSWDNGATWTSDDSITITGLNPGDSASRTLVVRDSAGNVSAGQVVSEAVPAAPTPITPAPATPVETVPDTTTPTSPLAISLETRVPSGTIPARRSSLQFAISGGSGTLTTTATFRSKTTTVRSDGQLNLTRLPEGRGTLKVTVTDTAGTTAVWSRAMLVDRTAPRVIAAEDYVLGSNVRLIASDHVSGLSKAPGRLQGLSLGRNVKRVRVRDRSGNSARRRVIITRRLSLTNAGANRGIKLWGGRASDANIHEIFSLDMYTPPWFISERLGPSYVREARWRLAQLGYLPVTDTGKGRIDVALVRATQRYQADRGIPTLGTIGPRTRAALDRDLSEI